MYILLACLWESLGKNWKCQIKIIGPMHRKRRKRLNSPVVIPLHNKMAIVLSHVFIFNGWPGYFYLRFPVAPERFPHVGRVKDQNAFVRIYDFVVK